MTDRNFFREAAELFGLGDLTAEPERVTGGYLHKMYRLETASGKYALKVLNPIIMERPDAMGNYRRAERIEGILWENGIPIVPALERCGVKMQHLEGRYFYLFRWSEGKTLGWSQIGEEHCRIAGRLLARIHKIPWSEEWGAREGAGPCDEGTDRAAADTRGTDWDAYIEEARRKCPEIAGELEENRDLLYLAEREYGAAVKSAPDLCCISDGDMDCKNVLWADDKPFLIDLECLSYGNPFLEMFQLALSWSGGAVCDMDFARFGGFWEAYLDEYGEAEADWKALSGIGYGWLDWLAYNTRRALGLECADGEERGLGIREVHETLRRIVYYHGIQADVDEYVAGLQ